MKCGAQEPKLRVFMNTTRTRKCDDDDENGNGDSDGDGDDGKRHLFHVLSVPSSLQVIRTSTSGSSVPNPNKTAISTNRPAVLPG
jgi:hypothetical protein